MKRICGIYRITSPSGRVYIGQSVNIESRFNKYKNLKCKTQPRIFNSLSKYGANHHNFEILELCDAELLNVRERFWQEKHNVIGDNGLNCVLTPTFLLKTERTLEYRSKASKSKIGNKNHLGKKHSEEAKLKMSLSHIGKKLSESHKLKLLNANLGRKMPAKVKEKFTFNGKTHSDESKKKMSIRATGRKMSNETINKIRLVHLGKKVSEETRDKIRKANTGKKVSYETKMKLSKVVFDTLTGVYYDNVREICNIYGYNFNTLHNKLNGHRKNNTKYIFA